jgi:hypothetical protein
MDTIFIVLNLYWTSSIVSGIFHIHDRYVSEVCCRPIVMKLVAIILTDILIAFVLREHQPSDKWVSCLIQTFVASVRNRRNYGKALSIMTTSHLRTRVERTPERSCI